MYHNSSEDAQKRKLIVISIATSCGRSFVLHCVEQIYSNIYFNSFVSSTVWGTLKMC